MGIRSIILSLFICLSLQAYGQDPYTRWDVRTGPGLSLLGSGDYYTLNFENELNYKLNRYFTGAASLNLGRALFMLVNEKVTFIQGNANMFFSPFTSLRKYDLRLGTGLTYYIIHENTIVAETYINGFLTERVYEAGTYNSLGFNVIIENNFNLSDRYLVGLKLFTQPYFNGDINTGAILKFGVKF